MQKSAEIPATRISMTAASSESKTPLCSARLKAVAGRVLFPSYFYRWHQHDWGYERKVWASTDGGTSWAELAASTSGRYPGCLAISPNGEQIDLLEPEAAAAVWCIKAATAEPVASKRLQRCFSVEGVRHALGWHKEAVQWRVVASGWDAADMTPDGTKMGVVN